MTQSISQTENPVNTNKPTAVIYSISDIGEYLVEIRQGDQHFFISADGENVRFGNLYDAQQAAKKQAVEQCFLALNRIYQEVDPFAENQNTGRFDYLPLSF